MHISSKIREDFLTVSIPYPCICSLKIVGVFLSKAVSVIWMLFILDT